MNDKQTVRLASGSGFWGDALDPAIEVLEKGNLDYLCFDYLAELTMALLQRTLNKDPSAGYIPDLLQHLKVLMPIARRQGTRLLSNGGGVNPLAGAKAVVHIAEEQGLRGLKVAAVEGDNLVHDLDKLAASGERFLNMETGEDRFSEIRDRIVCANVYTDASGMREALIQGADVVIAGRVSDNAVYVAPLMHEFGWDYRSGFDHQIGAAITLGHIVECAAACTGGMSSRFYEMPAMGKVGFPILEVNRDGSAIVTKVKGSGGRVDPFTIKEHLVYEIADPRNYVMPDGIADFTTLCLKDLGEDRVKLTNMSGRPPPETLKAVIGYEDGWIGEGMLFFPWPNAMERAEKAQQTLLERFERLQLKSTEMQFDYIGVNCLHGPAAPINVAELNEVGLRVAVHARTREEAEKVRRAYTHLWIMGPGGTSFGTPLKPRPVISVWPTLISRSAVRQRVTIMEIK